MPNLLVKIGKEFGLDSWEVLLSNRTQTYHILCNNDNGWSCPMPGSQLNEESIQQLIEFLQQTLKEKESDEHER